MNEIKENISLSDFTSFGIGGAARYFVVVKEIDKFEKYIDWAREKNLPIFILGGGSNLLISDNGFLGLVIKNEIKGTEMKGMASKDKNIIAGAGEALARVMQFAFSNNLTGLEWAAGIPGTIGGAVAGNAGAFGKSLANIFVSAQIFDLSELKVKEMKKEDCSFGYRDSIFKGNNNFLILSIELALNSGIQSEIAERMKANVLIHAKSNKHGKGSAGSIFKNIDWQKLEEGKEKFIALHLSVEKVRDRYKLPAGFLIEQVGLLGKEIGGAKITETHANTIINNHNATAAEVKKLIKLCQEKVYEKFKIKMEKEIELVGF